MKVAEGDCDGEVGDGVQGLLLLMANQDPRQIIPTATKPPIHMGKTLGAPDDATKSNDVLINKHRNHDVVSNHHVFKANKDETHEVSTEKPREDCLTDTPSFKPLNEVKKCSDAHRTIPQSSSCQLAKQVPCQQANTAQTSATGTATIDVAKPTKPLKNRLQQEIETKVHDHAQGSASNGQHCITHTPSLDELTSMASYVQKTVLPAASVYDLNNAQKEAMTLKEGIAKVRLPDGFFSTAPYGKDRTGRGPAWDAGTDLGDWMFSSPIKQNIRGMAGVYEYTHTDLKAISLAEFREKADCYRTDQTGSLDIDDPSDDDEEADQYKDTGELTQSQVNKLERQFWKRLSPTMPAAVYGADEAGTLFGDDEASGWSLAQLDSCLHVLADIPGVTSPYLYAGMWATVFCAHAEDMNLLSINYLHAGQPKIWYAVAEPDAARFVSLAEHHFVHQMKECKEFLRHKRCLLSPAILKKAGIRYQTAVQYPGDAVITFPGGYHFGFNAGFNVAEATNFGIPEWLPFGHRAKICLCRPDSVRIDMNRLTQVLQRCQKDQKRNRRLSFKEWRKRQERKDGVSKSTSIGNTEEGVIVVSYSPKKRKKNGRLSDQQRRKEFWIEVLQQVVGETKRKQKRIRSTWHLAKPLGRKRFETQMKVLCLIPKTNVASRVTHPSRGDSSSEEEKEDEEQCYVGTVMEIVDGHVRVHLDGLQRTEDRWIPESSSKIFLDGGAWKEDDQTIPALHYWQEVDSKKMVNEN